MKKLCSLSTLDEAEVLKSLLSSQNIEVEIKNKYIQSLAGRVPFTEVYPEIWILNDTDFEFSLKTLEDFRSPLNHSSSSWKCPTCREENEAQYDMCWNCGEERKAGE